jgi:hypothetical protein
MLYVVNYRGRQVHSAENVRAAEGQLLRFEGGGFADVVTGAVQRCAFVEPGDAGYIDPDQRLGSGIAVVELDAAGQRLYARTANSSVNASADGFYSESTGNPADREGVQRGKGNRQQNFFP